VSSAPVTSFPQELRRVRPIVWIGSALVCFFLGVGLTLWVTHNDRIEVDKISTVVYSHGPAERASYIAEFTVTDCYPADADFSGPTWSATQTELSRNYPSARFDFHGGDPKGFVTVRLDLDGFKESPELRLVANDIHRVLHSKHACEPPKS